MYLALILSPIVYLIVTVAMMQFSFPVGITMLALAVIAGPIVAAKFAG